MASITHTSLVDSHDEHAGHPTDLTYWKVGLFLAVLTGLEVSTYWWPKSMHKVTAVLLIIMMLIKFATVALYFMHLKFDAKILRNVFVAGFTLALGVYIAALGSMVFFDNSGNVEEIYNDPPRSKPQPPPSPEPPPIIKPIVHHG